MDLLSAGERTTQGDREVARRKLFDDENLISRNENKRALREYLYQGTWLVIQEIEKTRHLAGFPQLTHAEIIILKPKIERRLRLLRKKVSRLVRERWCVDCVQWRGMSTREMAEELAALNTIRGGMGLPPLRRLPMHEDYLVDTERNKKWA